MEERPRTAQRLSKGTAASGRGLVEVVVVVVAAAGVVVVVVTED